MALLHTADVKILQFIVFKEIISWCLPNKEISTDTSKNKNYTVKYVSNSNQNPNYSYSLSSAISSTHTNNKNLFHSKLSISACIENKF